MNKPKEVLLEKKSLRTLLITIVCIYQYLPKQHHSLWENQHSCSSLLCSQSAQQDWQLLRAAVDHLGEGTVSLCGFVFPQDNNPDTLIVKTQHFNPWSVWRCLFHSGLPSSHAASPFEAKVPPGHHTVLGKSSHRAEVALQNNQIFQSSGWTFLKYLGKSAWSCQEFLFLTGTSSGAFFVEVCFILYPWKTLLIMSFLNVNLGLSNLSKLKRKNSQLLALPQAVRVLLCATLHCSQV